MTKTQDTDPKDKIIDVALNLADVQGWDTVTLYDVARDADMTLATLFEYVDDKNDILVLLGKKIDKRVLEVIGEPDSSVSTRDQLFDILMERFEILNDYRAGVLAMVESFRYDPKQAVISSPYLCKSMSWMLEAAGIDTSGIMGAVKVAGLTGVYLKTLRVWRDDESTDMAKVMAALDKDLGRVEQVANTLGL